MTTPTVVAKTTQVADVVVALELLEEVLERGA
jgi:hypothetical protein